MRTIDAVRRSGVAIGPVGRVVVRAGPVRVSTTLFSASAPSA